MAEDRRKRIAIIWASSFLLVATIIVLAVGMTRKESHNKIEDNQKNHIASTVKAVKSLCYPTDYKKECEESLMQAVFNTTDPKELVKIAFNITISKIGDKLKQPELLHELEKEPRAKLALETCKKLMDLSSDEFLRSLDKVGEFDLTNLENILTSLKVWLSGAITYQDICLDGFENITNEAGKKMKELLTTTMHTSSNALPIITEMDGTVTDWNVKTLVGGRRILMGKKKF